MNKRILTYVGAALLAAAGAALLFFSLSGTDDTEPQAAAVDETPIVDADAGVSGDVADIADQTDEIVDSRFAGTGLAERVKVPEEFLEMTFALDTERAAGGQLRAGDTVAVLYSAQVELVSLQTSVEATDLILHKILVTNILEDDPEPLDLGTIDLNPQAPSGRIFVTVALSADDAEALTFALEFGRIWLAYEPETADETSPGLETTDTILDEAGFLELTDRMGAALDAAAARNSDQEVGQ